MNAPMTIMLDKKRAKNYAEQQGLYVYDYPRPGLTADVVVVCRTTGRVLFIRRKNDPFKGCWALPGGFVDIEEESSDAAIRELKEETGIELLHKPDFIGLYDAPKRDPRGRTVSAVYIAVFNDSEPEVKPADDADDFSWFDPTQVVKQLAFDHNKILIDAMKYYNHNLKY